MVAGTVAGLGSMTTLSFPVHRLFHTFLERFSRWIKPPDDFPRAWTFSQTAVRKRIVAATIDHLASYSFRLNCEEHHVLKMGLLIPFRLKRS